jgi:hypothetical protein
VPLRPWRTLLSALLALGFGLVGEGTPAARAENLGPPLRFSITEGRTENHFYRRGPVAAHAVVTSGEAPRLVVAFPAGNTGAGLWFAPGESPVSLRLAPGAELAGLERPDGLRGIVAHLQSDASALTVRSALLANIRSIREYIWEGARAVPPALASTIAAGPPVVFHRATVDGRHHVELQLAGAAGTTVVAGPDGVQVRAGPRGRIDLMVTALTDEPPLTPFATDELFTAGAADRPLDRQVFAFLASAEKLTAGSWRFLTYFGRDTLLTLQLLMPVLQPPVIEGALGSVLERLGPGGEVAHEEGIGEYATLHNLQLTPRPADLRAPELDYKMIDGEFLLAPAVAAYLLDTPAGRARAAAFLARRTPGGETYAARLEKNLSLVLSRTAPFTAHPIWQNLVALKDGISVGNWRDSDHGLGGGRYPYDVNAALAPAALRAAARLYRSGLLGEQTTLAIEAEKAAEVWKTAESHFRLEVPVAAAKEQVADYAAGQQLAPADALASLAGPVAYHALALDAAGQPVPVMHTDEAFALFFGEPAPAHLEAVAGQILRPFPAGLRTAVGLVVANPVFGDAKVRRTFTRDDYHGTVVWSWQQALLAAGLQRQLARTDLPAATRARLVAAQKALWAVITAMPTQSAGELWSWEPRAGREALAPYGQAKTHADESNAAQLWSTVYLAVQPPQP